MFLKTTILLTFYCVCFVNGRSWSGADYWTSRYSSNGIKYKYNQESNIWWNNFYNGGHGYEPPQVSGSSCGKCKCSKDTVDCTKVSGIVKIHNLKNLKRIDENGLSAATTTLTIRGTGLETIHQNAFKNLRNLRKLLLIKNRLTELPDLSNCIKLEVLNVYDNNIDIPSHKVIRLPRSLKEINFIKNKVKRFPNDIFNLPNLELIALSHNRLTSFPKAAFGNNARLQYLAVDGNQIRSILRSDLAPFLQHKSRLQHLNMSNNVINSIAPFAFSQLPRLKIMELHNNEIRRIIKGTFKYILNLLHISMNSNMLKQLTAGSFEDLPKLKVLLLHSQRKPAQLSTVYYNSIKNLPSLEQLWLSNNKLNVIPFPMLHEGTWAKLKELHLDHNRIESLNEYSHTEFLPSDQSYFRSRKPFFKPFDTSTAIEKLYLGSNLIKQVGARDLALLPNLKILILRSNHISSLSGVAFKYNVQLHNIDLQINHLKKIENGCLPSSLIKFDVSDNQISLRDSSPFKNLKKLRTLYVARNRVDVLPNDVFSGLPNLASVYLGQNKIGKLLRVHMKDMRKLEYFVINNNKLSYIEPGAFNHLKRLTFMQFSSNQLRTILAGTFNNLRVPYLYFDGNKLTTIKSNAFVGISGCTILSFKSNNIKSIETNAFKNVKCLHTYFTHSPGARPRLRIIATKAFNKFSGLDFFLDGTDVIKLPRDSFYDVNLRNLYLQNGRIANIEERAFRVSITGKLDLSKNKLRNIGKHIFHSTSKVNTLVIRQNQIQTLHKKSFDGLSIASSLDLSYNKLTVAPIAQVSHFTKLKLLNLGSNQIANIAKDAFSKLTSLIYLHLFRNKLKHLPAMGILPKLRTLNLANNQLETVDKDAFQYLGAISRVSLANNPISCDCLWYRNIYPIASKVVNARCSKPPALRGFHLDSKASMSAKKKQFPCGLWTFTAKPPGSTTNTTVSSGDGWRKAKYYAQGFFISRSSQPKVYLSNEILLIAFYFSTFIYYI